jgi:membrane associated rhomboid family serine protease
MGIYDRDYYREDSRWRNPFARSQATLFLVLLYCFVFIVQVASERPVPARFRGAELPGINQGRDPVTTALELDVQKTLDGEVWRVVTYALIHQPGNLFHIIFTCVFLVWIGHQVEDLYGWKEYLAYYFVSTLVGGVAYLVVGYFIADCPMLIGPSGAVTAVLVLFAMHYPTRSISFRFFIISFRFFIPIPVWLLVAIYALTDIGGLTHGHANPAAVAVHLAGAAFAFVYHTYTLRVLNIFPGARGSRKSVRRMPQPKLRVRRDEPEPEPAATAASAAGAGASASGSSVDEHLEAKLDEVLEKVQRHGKESLTEDERGILLRASEIYKKKRRPG